MKKLYVLFLSISLCATHLSAQDIPLFSQKLTNSFIYNPAVAGNTVGSLTYAHRQQYGNISNAPRANFLSVHTPFKKHKFGVGANVYQEEINFLQNTYTSAAFAYHVRFNRFTTLSFGVSGEYNMLRLKGTSNSNLEDSEYLKLSNGELNDIDYSFGSVFQNRYVKVGIAANRLATAWFKEENQNILSNYYSGFIQGTIPLRDGKDILEPYVAYRKFSDTNEAYDVGLFYTYNNLLTGGLGMRQGGVANATLGVRLAKKLMLGYSHEVFTGNAVRGALGSSHELTLRLDFNEFNYQTNFQTTYRNALAYRRKTLSAPVGKVGSRSPQQLHQKQKKHAAYSPNQRYQNIQKLSVTPASQRQKISSSKKKSYKRKKRR